MGITVRIWDRSDRVWRNAVFFGQPEATIEFRGQRIKAPTDRAYTETTLWKVYFAGIPGIAFWVDADGLAAFGPTKAESDVQITDGWPGYTLDTNQREPDTGSDVLEQL